MLIEIRDVKAHIQPETILTQALQEGDLSIDAIVRECIAEEDYESVLDAVDNDDILNYVQRYDLDIKINTLEQVFRAIPELTKSDKAKLLWQLLQCKED